MSQRRMFSRRITDQAKFLQMPDEVQNLYFHLGLATDDDGIVESFSIMRKLNAKEDSLRLLIAKGFILPLNEDFVMFVTDWHEHNKIRADRKKDSIYKHLLPEGVKTIEAKRRADLKPLKEPEKSGRPLDAISKDKLSKVKLSKVKKKKLTDVTDEVIEIFDYWNEKKIVVHKKITETITKKINKRLNELTVDEIKRGIDVYDSILKNPRKLWSYKWTLAEFIGRENGVEQFYEKKESDFPDKNNSRGIYAA